MSTPTIALSQLHSDLLRIYAHGLSPTNVVSIQHTAGGAVYFVTDTSELEADLAEAKASEARQETELADAQTKIDSLKAENKKLTEMHADFKDPESGVTPATYREQAEEAERRRVLYERAMNEARLECEALRKRKGIECELFKNAREIQDFLQLCAAGKMPADAVVKCATAIRVKLHPK